MSRAAEARLIALRLLPWIAVIGLLGGLSYLRLLDTRLAPLRTQARLLIEQGVSIVGADLAGLSRDVLVLGQAAAVSSAVGSAVSSGRTQALESALLTFARASRTLARVAWIDERGRERAAAVLEDGQVRRVAPGDLRGPGAMPWLAGLADLLPAEVRLAPLAPSREGVPVLRAASPVYDPQGRQRGMVLIEHDLRRTLATLHGLDQPGLAPLALIGPEGQPVGGEATRAPLAQDDLDLWARMQQQGRGRREDERGMWHFQDFLPSEPGPGRLAVAPWYFVAHATPDTVARLRMTSAWQCAAGAAAALLLALAATLHRRLTERERERLLADLQANHQALAAAKTQTEDSLRQLRQLQSELVQAEKLASLGLLVAGVAHELNTPLGSARVTASTLARRLDDAQREAASAPLPPARVEAVLARQRTGLEIIEHSLERSGQVIRLFKQLAVDRAAVERRQFLLADVLDDVVRLLAPRLEGSPVRLRLEPGPPVALDSYPGPLGQVVENLIANALLHAFDPPADAAPPPEVAVRARLDGPDGPLDLEVTDNGCGIDPSVRPRIFDPFFTTRRGRGGTGIGLHLCHHFCSQVLGGRILVESAPGQGSRFTVRIPLRAP